MQAGPVNRQFNKALIKALTNIQNDISKVELA
jgi:hypothetical protein